MPRVGIAAALLCALVAFAANDALAQSYPSRPIKLIVALAPGGQNDTIARVFGDALSGVVKQPVMVENHAGASGTIGANLVAKAAPDGYTLLVGGAFNLALAPALMSNLPYDVGKDFVPLGGLARVPYALAVRSGVAATTLPELIAYARANPGRLSYGSSGVGSNSSLAVELLKSAAGLDIVHVPYKGSAPAVAALVGGQIDVVCMDLALLAPHAKAGTLRLVAAASATRPSLAPGLATAAEQGLPALVLEPWYGVVAPAGLPVDVREKLASAINAAVRMPELRRRFEQLGYETIVDTPEAFAALIRSETAKYARLIDAAKIPRDR
ncbi:MAG TPA: tripartite tricarboxylate transporter substrate-binding protein [Casimicrobiaceae bacterium]|nr:tripartite tricarboxylate transporter substrate-binding protein [Casimicrobiaceae bacterium]